MIPYIYYPDIELDIDKLEQTITYHFDKTVPGLLSYQRLVKDCPYMMELQKKYNILSSTYNIYVFSKTIKLPVHIDSGRQAALNIPIKNTEASDTIFYSFKDTQHKTFNADRVYDQLAGNLSEVYRFTMTRPVIFNTTIPHSVVVDSGVRISLSWSVLPKYSFDDAVKFFNECAVD